MVQLGKGMKNLPAMVGRTAQDAVEVVHGRSALDLVQDRRIGRHRLGPAFASWLPS